MTNHLNTARAAPRRADQARSVLSAALFACTCAALATAQPTIVSDPASDAVIRRTDVGNDGDIDPMLQRLPDVVELRLGKFAPALPHVDPFDGSWNVAGAYARYDVVFEGLVNPPGPLGLDDGFPLYDPFVYGPNPVFGWLELDLDADVDTGGELDDSEYRYLGSVSRFGGLPSEPRFIGRAATMSNENDDNVSTAPFVERSGEEFHLALNGEDIDYVTVLVEKPGGNPAIFEEGETWTVEGELFHRAHGFENFAFTCIARPGRYKPLVQLRFSHDAGLDQTTISLVYPLTNAADAAMIDPGEPVEPNDGCEDNQNSIEEALIDLQFSAEFADPLDRMQPEFILIEGWEFNLVANHLDPAQWLTWGVVGSAYGQPQGEFQRYIWTDVWPDPLVGDFDASGGLDAADTTLLNQFIVAHDGEPGYDDDGNNANGSLTWPDFARGFCLFDTNYDGLIDATDAVVLGDMDLNQVLQFEDVDDLVEALLTPEVYINTHNGVLPHIRGDMNHDGRLDALDIAEFLAALMS